MDEIKMIEEKIKHLKMYLHDIGRHMDSSVQDAVLMEMKSLESKLDTIKNEYRKKMKREFSDNPCNEVEFTDPEELLLNEMTINWGERFSEERESFQSKQDFDLWTKEREEETKDLRVKKKENKTVVKNLNILFE